MKKTDIPVWAVIRRFEFPFLRCGKIIVLHDDGRATIVAKGLKGDKDTHFMVAAVSEEIGKGLQIAFDKMRDDWERDIDNLRRNHIKHLFAAVVPSKTLYDDIRAWSEGFISGDLR